MLNRIAIGKYVYGTSLIHKENPIIKLICSLCYIICLFLVESKLILLFGFLLLLELILSRISWNGYFQLIWQSRFLLIFLFLFNFLFGVSIYKNLFLMFQLIGTLLYSSMVLYTTPIGDLTYAVMVLLSPLSLLHIPIGILSHMIGLALSFLPIMMEQANCLFKALSVRGIDYFHSKFREKIFIWKLILLPLFDRSFHYADAVANTMEVRLYDVNVKKVNFRKFEISYFDMFQIVIHFLLLLLVLKEGIL